MTRESAALLVFALFALSFAGWVLETAQESIVRKKFVNKGFFKGPYVPVQGIGGICVYLFCLPLKAHPALVFLSGMVVCTVIEYFTALFLDKFFKVKAWDYTTYPHTKWCHYKGRICLTISLVFGLLSLFLVYVGGHILMNVANFLGNAIWPVDGYLLGVFTADAVYSCNRIIKLNKAGIKAGGYSVFSDTSSMGK
ncbi:MAG: putative ABC transporter permease [Spirochaetaceae bacterium]|jgi:uncharacterized membrane protein|nr:putative ABC transporter permease [Spirochaetaceae bacterium]